MKIQCDVCSKDEASVFCVADDAALCAACDHRVHHANKLAEKHQRFCLLHPSPKQAPICDICQERRAFLFCQQDRAILCRECDISIHKANEKIQKHNRLILTGVKLSATSALYSSSDSTLTNVSETVPLIKGEKILKDKPVPVKPTSTITNTTWSTSEPVKAAIADRGGGSVQLMNGGGNNGSSSTSSISEYLMEILPGLPVDDFLDSPCGFFKSGDSDALPLWDADLDNNLTSISQENMGFWVPQSPPLYPSLDMVYAAPNGFKDSKEISSIKSSKKWSDDNMYAVPQISPPSTAFKRSRTSW